MTGFGVIDCDGNRTAFHDCGVIKLPTLPFPERLRLIFDGIAQAIESSQPDEVAVEQVFVNRNPGSALKLGQARGAAICAAVVRDLPVAEYTPASVKQAIVGGGRADKEQVQHMVRVLLGLAESPQADAADALAVALCHAHTRQTLRRFRVAGGAGGRIP
jgi:crossover junction endodeoxyribonuclease RuvC